MSQPAKRALIVIDVQNEYVTGKLRIEYPDVQTSLANIGQAMDAARDAGIPINQRAAAV
jgi:nicotinamidase-related amidase